MTPNYQQADMLDMVFENRNQAYGAYVLRRTYNKSLQQAIVISLSSVLLLFSANMLREKLSKNAVLATTNTHDRTIYDGLIVEPPKQAKKILPPKPPVPPKTLAAPAATLRETEMKVVQNNQPKQDTLPAKPDLQAFAVGATTKPKGATDGGGAVDGTGTGPGIDVFTAAKPSGPDYTTAPEVMPIFPGGEKALLAFLAKNTQYPYRERDLGIQGKTLVRFIVNEDGSISRAEILHSASNGFSDEAERVLGIMPHFKPGMQQGHPVKVQMVIPFTFQLKD